MARVIFNTRRELFKAKNKQFQDMVTAHMAQEIELLIKTGGRTPVKTGDMKAEVRHFKVKQGVYRVESPKEYSAVQEAGRRMTGPGAPTDQFTNYTTAGTGKGWFADAVMNVVRRDKQFISEAKRSLNIT